MRRGQSSVTAVSGVLSAVRRQFMQYEIIRCFVDKISKKTEKVTWLTVDFVRNVEQTAELVVASL